MRASPRLVIALVGIVGAACTDRGAAGPPAPDADPAVSLDAPAARVRNSPGTAALLALLRARSPSSYDAAVIAGVEFAPTSDGDSLYAYWTPPAFDPARSGFVVTLHGHDGFVADAFAAWRPFLEEHGYGFLALQWWFGGGETIADYYLPDEIVPLFREGLAAHGIPGGKILFEAFSRGSANSYAVTAIDHASAAPMFVATIANAGQAVSSYPPTRAIDDGAYGPQPFAGTHFMLYCGELDREAMANGCQGMRMTEPWLVGYGATIDLFLQDPTGGHGGFHMNPANCTAALAVYDRLRAAP